jgi:hypothetical protein
VERQREQQAQRARQARSLYGEEATFLDGKADGEQPKKPARRRQTKGRGK